MHNRAMSPHRRRRPVLAGTLILLSTFAAAEPVTLELWPKGTPGADRVTVREETVERLPEGPLRDRYVQHVTKPLLTLFPPSVKPNGVALLIVPGGGYVRVVIDKEGFEAAEWFRARGFTVGVLRYRLPGDRWPSGADAPVHDAQRAMRLLREGMPAGFATPDRVGVLGYSAGGHLAARLITEPAVSYARQDALDDVRAMPDFAVLLYPVITMGGPLAHPGSGNQLLAAGVPADTLVRYSADRNVTPGTPRTLLIHAADDATVPVENSLFMHAALRKAGVRSELHVFDRGGHGFGLRAIAGKPVAAWPMLAQAWALDHE
jgi:acetyl esterase/lipase